MNRNLPRAERRFSGTYAKDGKARRLQVRADAGHRCIRCGHPFKSGEHGKGEWSPCDDRCTHSGPIRWRSHTLNEWTICDRPVAAMRELALEVEAQWRILTVHHLDGDKGNDAWWNTLALCQRCHLQIQGKVNPHIPWMLSHSDWFKPYVAGFYAHKYEGRMIEREEAERRMDELLAYEFKA